MKPKELYAEYVKLYAEWGIEKETWKNLTQTDREVWKSLAKSNTGYYIKSDRV